VADNKICCRPQAFKSPCDVKFVPKMQKTMKIALVGATGLVGTKMLQVLDEQNFPYQTLLPVASQKSAGKELEHRGKSYQVLTAQQALDQKPQLALFSAGGSVSLELAPEFAKIGCTVIDNSSAWRMSKPLIVPEINAHILTAQDKIIANPNCSTIQMVMVLAPLHKKFNIKRIVVSTYQSVTGTGKKAVDQMMAERKGEPAQMVYPHPIDQNALPQVDVFLENGYTKEEMKMVNETKKILSDSSIEVTATCVRIPTIGGHSEAVNVEFSKPYELEEIREILAHTPGVVLQDDPQNSIYPMPLTSHERDEVFVGRLRRDFTLPNTLNMWIVADNLRKGAATNAVQIASYLLNNGLL
jgi:aspartate-semialdehyde dehydrogenase